MTSRPPKARDGASRAGTVTRRRLVDAAVQCILELGYYRTSSNEIARKAGVTWGVIQHHFGSRERLMLEVLRDASHRLVEHTEGVVIAGDSLRERLDAYYEHLAGFYGRPEYLAYVEISLNLARDPATSAETRQTLDELAASLRDIWCGVPGLSSTMSLLVFESIRGLLLSHRLRDDSLTPNVDPERDFEHRIAMLLDLVAHAAEHQEWEHGAQA